MKGKWCLVVRLGGIGDHLIVSSVLPRLKAEGWMIAYMSQKPTNIVVHGNPHIDRHIEIENGIPAEDFVKFFEMQKKSYDRVLNFSETIEKALLLRNDQLAFYWEPETIRDYCGVNYLEQTHRFARVDQVYRPEFFPTQEESDEIDSYIEGWGGKVVGVQVAGSNFDKMNPHLPEIVTKILLAVPDAKVMLLGGASKRDTTLMEGVIETVRHWTASLMRVKNASQKPIRWALTFAKKCDLLIGPDSGLMWAGSFEPVPKIVMLSHASPENITKHWVNTTTFHADQSVGCWPCHKLHHGPDTCTLDTRTKSALCMASINPDAVVAAAIKHLKGVTDVQPD
jgi:ADP-heptose:LPS heptosyltransferase